MGNSSHRNQKDRIRRARSSLGRLNTKHSKVTRKLQDLERKRAVIERDKKCLETAKELLVKHGSLRYLDMENYDTERMQSIVAAFDETDRACFQLKPKEYKSGVVRLQQRIKAQRPFHEVLHKRKRYADFLEENGLALWFAICSMFVGLEKHGEFYYRELTKEMVEFIHIRMAQHLWAETNWELRGRAFKTTSLLANTFTVADIPVPISMMKPPFPVMLIEAPLTFVVENDKDEVVSASEVLVCCDDSILVATLNDRNKASVNMAFALPLNSDRTVQEELHAQNAHGHPILGFVCNAILYCSSFPQDIKANNEQKIAKIKRRIERLQDGSHKAKDARRKLSRAQRDSIYILGSGFRLDDERADRELSRDDCDTSRIKHIVRGHWRNQACGPRHTKRKLVFVQPHWRGAGRPGQDKTYIVTDRGQEPTKCNWKVDNE